MAGKSTKRGRPAQKRSATATEIKEKSAKKPQPKKEVKSSNRELKAILIFAFTVLSFCLIIIEGQSLWTSMRDVLYGLFGVTVYTVPVFLGIITFFFAKDKFRSSVRIRTIEAIVLVWFIAGAVDIFCPHPAGQLLSEHMSASYNLGVVGWGGGFFGSMIGAPLYFAFGKAGAIVIIFLLIFVLFMILTGTTIMKLFDTVSKPVKKFEQHASMNFEQKKEIVTEDDKKSQKREFDFPVDDIPEKRENDEMEEISLAQKGKKVISTYNSMEDDSNKKDYDADDEAPFAIEDDVENAAFGAKERVEDSDDIILPYEKSGKAEKQQEITKEDISAFSKEVIDQAEGQAEAVYEYKFPPVNLLKENSKKGSGYGEKELQATAENLVNVLRSFGVETRIVDVSRGPAVTRYELQPSAGVKISKITSLSDDIALNLATAGVRIEAPIPNKAAIGIEVPNKVTSSVGVRDIIETVDFMTAKSKLTIALGKDIAGKAIMTDIGKMPHGLIAGSTGSGKSVCINSIIISLLYKASPDDVKLLMIDPKVVELGIYNGIPHLLVPVVTDPRKASGALAWAVTEMEKRYRLFAENDVRNLEGYNHLAEMSDDLPKIPHIVIIIDELADLMMTSPKEVEDSICRIAQKARAAGMHLIIATQRPSVDVVTGLIKANVPTRIAFAVSSQVDSRTIIDVGGAEKLLGKGDMLFCPVGANKPTRIQGCFVSDEEVERVVSFIKNSQQSDYDEAISEEIERIAAANSKDKGAKNDDSVSGADRDPMIYQAIECVIDAGRASASHLQSRLKLGYARASRIINEMEEMGVIGPYEGAKPRQVLITKAEFLEMQANSSDEE